MLNYQVVIGLEIHVQLNTLSKLFSGASTKFGQKANSQANIIDLGLPGVLPNLNQDVLRKSIQLGTSLGSKINRYTQFTRKNYFYPDLPKGYQITQDVNPIIVGGSLDILLNGKKKTVRIHHAHLEEDAGKSIHDPMNNRSLIDLNRAGQPLIEIVTEPDIRSIDEAICFLKKLHQLVCYLNITDGNMQEGSFRCDANISLRKLGTDPYGTRVEIKNLNSFKFIEKALLYEIKRQSELLESNGTIIQQTRLFDESTSTTKPMRDKETANDYRYFLEPDLPPITISEPYINAIIQQMPELPDVKRHKYIERYQLTEYDATVLSSSIDIANYFEAVIALQLPTKLTANWILGPLLSLVNKHNIHFRNLPITPERFAGLLITVDKQTISSTQGKEVLEIMYSSDQLATEIIQEKGMQQISDESELITVIESVIQSHPKQVQQYLEGKEKLLGFFVGQIMKATKGKANPSLLNKLVKQSLNSVKS
ncbi:MAG TPA: Asp-tRNA(Asn)/Glu-tRNA(Gln) amidotransferase subunit GatB [Gammaproteobacteria bacterium]|nr:Asp-tRNA(Asn)/Glu-tRNA(Gln) amidotransferase subunit GatB [Gammaproteobacteria bacterium]